MQQDPSIRPADQNDLEHVVDYFLNADKSFLRGMGVDPDKLLNKEEWLTLLSNDQNKDIENRSFFYLIWLLKKKPVGHSNINKIKFGEEAYMHLHLWRDDKREKGIGFEFMKLCLPYFLTTFKLKRLYCEPYALNPAPNKMLKKLGFDFIKQYETIPGWINFHQPVNCWCMDVSLSR